MIAARRAREAAAVPAKRTYKTAVELANADPKWLAAARAMVGRPAFELREGIPAPVNGRSGLLRGYRDYDAPGYREYIRSDPTWKFKREAAVERADGRCERCGEQHERLQVHHRTYADLYAEAADQLEVLCPSCHLVADRERKGK